MKRFFKIIGIFISVILLLIVIALWLLTKEKYQNILAKRGAKYLAEQLNTRVEIAHVKLSFFNNFNLQGVYIEDSYKDTLAYIGNIQLKTSELLSNYWNKNKSIIKHVGLSNVYVNLNRKKDSTWNYDFISNAFGSSKTKKDIDVKIVKEEQSAPSLEFDLKEVLLENIRFDMNDGWRGEDMNFAFASLHLKADDINLEKKNIRLEDLIIDGANIAVREYDGYKPKDNTPDDTTSWGTPFNPDKMEIKLGNLKITNSDFSYSDGNSKPNPKEFDERYLAISNLNISLKDTRVVADTIFSSIEKFTAKERCGLSINELTAQLKLSQVQASLNQLKLVTNHSLVQGHYEMNYKNFHDFNDYISKVNMKAHLQNSSVSSLDIGYFANILNQYPIQIEIAGMIDGTVDNMRGTNLSIHSKNTSFKGDAKVVGLPDIEKTYFDVTNINLNTSGKDLNMLIPQTKTNGVAWEKLSNINYRGSYQGMVDEFYTKGQLNTSLGNAIIDLKMNFKPKHPSYAGHIETENFDIGKLIKQNSIGKISMKGKIDGSGFDLENLNAKVDATVSKIEIDSTQYSDLTINGLVSKKKFDGIFISQDPSLAVNFNGILDLSGKQPVYNFNTRFLRFDLKKLGLTKESVIGTGFASLHFTGSTIDDFTGTASLKNVSIENKGKTIHLDDVLLESYQSSAEKTLRLSSSLADAEVKGNFNISGLPDAIMLYLHYYLPEYIKMPKKQQRQELTYTVAIKNVDSVLNTFLPDIFGLSGSVISGSLNTQSQIFSLDANIVSGGYKEFFIKDLIVVGAGDYKEFDLNITTGNFLYNNDVIIPSMQVNGIMANYTANLSIVTQSVNDVLGDAFLNLRGTALNKNLYVTILPSNFSIKEDKWQLQSKDELVFGPQIKITDLIVESGAQKLTFNTTNTNGNNLKIDLSELDIHNITGYLNQTKPAYFGRVSGTVNVDNFIDAPLISAAIYSTNPVRIDNDTLGLVNVNMSYDVAKNNLIIDKQTTIKRGNDKAYVEGSVNMKDSTIALQTTLSNTSISLVNQFISDYIKDLRGNLSGSVSVNGRVSKPNVTGDLILNDASFKVIYLGTSYKTNNVKFHFNNESITLQDLDIYDERNQNFSAKVTGSINHKNFSDIKLNMHVNSNNFVVLNTTEWDNDLFYGYIISKLDADVNGYLDDITLDLKARPLKGSSFHMPISSSGDASTYDYISFVEIGTNQNGETKKKSSNYFKINMDIEATPDVEAYIILDKNTREEIVARGNGDISLRVDMGNSMNMFGTYIISEGKYEFNFRGVFPRTFTIDEGSKIAWNGDPLKAKLDVKAIYKIPNPLPLFPLIQDANADETEITEAKKKYDTYVSLTLQNELATPDIKFDISQPNNKSIGTLAYDKLTAIKNDEKELISQAGVLLLLGEFKGSNGLGGSVERGGVATASDMISSALSSSLTNVFSEVTGLKNISLNLGYKTYSFGDNQANINQFNFGVSANLFKERVVVDFGSNVDVDRNTVNDKGASTINFGGDFKAQYLVTDDGRLRVNAFRTTNYNADGNNFVKGGVGVSYKKVFNHIRDFFTSKKNKQKNKQEDASLYIEADTLKKSDS